MPRKAICVSQNIQVAGTVRIAGWEDYTVFIWHRPGADGACEHGNAFFGSINSK
jgi:hypothetical protein